MQDEGRFYGDGNCIYIYVCLHLFNYIYTYILYVFLCIIFKVLFS